MLRQRLKNNNGLHRLLTKSITTETSSNASGVNGGLRTPLIKEFIGNDIKVVHNHKWTSFEFLQQNKSYSYNNAFLRDASNSINSIDPESGQKLFTTASIIESYPKKIEIPTNDRIKIHWNDGEISEYNEEFLINNSTIENRKFGKNFDEDIKTWDHRHSLSLETLPKYQYNDYLRNDDKNLETDVLNNLNKHGIVQVINIETFNDDKLHDESPIVKKLAEKIGFYVKKTFYGEIFDVKSIPNAKNIAYTDQFLPLHQDLLYYESPPGLQLLHCIKNKATGGENVFADGFAAARHVKSIDPSAYQALLTVPINYHYDKDGFSYYYSRPLIVENDELKSGHGSFGIYGEKDHFKEVNYSPPFQAPFDFGITGDKISNSVESGAKELGDRHLFQDFLRGLKEFEDYINEPSNQLTFKLEENTCIIFDNRRILHARNQFDNTSGERWLKGCYLDKDSYLSKLRMVKKN